MGMTGDGVAAVTVVEDFDAFYRSEFRSMVALAASVGGGSAAEDLAQEAMVRAHRNWHRVGAYDNPGTWVRRVTINLATSTARRRAAELRAKVRLRNRARPTLVAPDPVHDPVWAAVAQLPPQQRAAIALHYLEDRSVADIAEILECTPSTAKNHLHKGRTRLAQVLEGGTDD